MKTFPFFMSQKYPNDRQDCDIKFQVSEHQFRAVNLSVVIHPLKKPHEISAPETFDVLKYSYAGGSGQHIVAVRIKRVMTHQFWQVLNLCEMGKVNSNIISSNLDNIWSCNHDQVRYYVEYSDCQFWNFLRGLDLNYFEPQTRSLHQERWMLTKDEKRPKIHSKGVKTCWHVRFT